MLLIILTFVMTFTTKGYDIELAYEVGLLSRNEENFTILIDLEIALCSFK